MVVRSLACALSLSKVSGNLGCLVDLNALRHSPGERERSCARMNRVYDENCILQRGFRYSNAYLKTLEEGFNPEITK